MDYRDGQLHPTPPPYFLQCSSMLSGGFRSECKISLVPKLACNTGVFRGSTSARISVNRSCYIFWICKLLRAIYMVRLCRMGQTYDRPMTQIVSCKSNLQLAYNCRVHHKRCLRYDNRRYMQSWMTRVLCNFLHDVSIAHSRNRMPQSWAKVVPSKWAFREPHGQTFYSPQSFSAFKIQDCTLSIHSPKTIHPHCRRYS